MTDANGAYRVEDLADGEIAAVLGCRESTVRSNAARGLATLRAVVDEAQRVRPDQHVVAHAERDGRHRLRLGRLHLAQDAPHLAHGGGEPVEAAVVVMEDSRHFNAGYGAALCESGEHELDASAVFTPDEVARILLDESGYTAMLQAERSAEAAGDVAARQMISTLL